MIDPCKETGSDLEQINRIFVQNDQNSKCYLDQMLKKNRIWIWKKYLDLAKSATLNFFCLYHFMPVPIWMPKRGKRQVDEIRQFTSTIIFFSFLSFVCLSCILFLLDVAAAVWGPSVDLPGPWTRTRSVSSNKDKLSTEMDSEKERERERERDRERKRER